MPKIVAIIVIYNPDGPAVCQLIDAIENRVDEIVVVSNGVDEADGIKIKAKLRDTSDYIDLGCNTGVAKAFNCGIDVARQNHASHVILFDQDSVPLGNMIENLLHALQTETQAGNQVAAVGPQYTDVKDLVVSPVVLSGIRLKQIDCQLKSVVAVDHLISSGCLIAMDALDVVGPMNEDLFIDNVDVEWCLRAKKYGYTSYGVCGEFMQHDMGDKLVDVFGFKANVHTPLRNYYMMRNGVWLVKQSWLPFNRRLAEFFKLMKKYIVYSLFIGSCYSHWSMMSKGVWHALSGRMGKYD